MATYELRIQKSGSSYYHYLTISVTEQSQDLVNNKTTLAYSVTFHASSSTRYHYNYNNLLWLSINGTALKSSDDVGSIYIEAGESKFLTSGTITVPHNSDGTKSVSVYCRFKQESTYDNNGTWTFNCTTIPRAGTITGVSGTKTLGNTVTISVSRQSTAFIHVLTYKCGQTTGTISSNVGSSASWTAPKSLASNNTKGEKVTVQFTLQTKNGSSVVGTNTYSVEFNIQADAVLSIGTVQITEKNTTKLPQDVFSGIYVQGFSKLEFSTSVSTGSAYGATPVSAEMIIGQSSFSGTISGNSITFAQASITAYGSLSAQLRITDSRGRVVTKSHSFSVFQYSAPAASLTVIRCNASGVEDPAGAYAKYTAMISMAGIYSSGQKNYITATLKSTPSSGTARTISLCSQATDVSRVFSDVIQASTDNLYTYLLTVSDRWSTTRVEVNIGSGFTLVDYHSSGRGMAIGKVAQEEGLLDIGLDVNFDGEVDFANPINADINGNATSSSSCSGNAATSTRTSAVKDKTNSTDTYLNYATTVTSGTYVAIWDGYTLKKISLAALRNILGLGNTTGVLPVANGGTGAANTLAAKQKLEIDCGAGTANSDTSTYISFNIRFSSTPRVVAQFAKTGSNVTGNRGSLKVYNITTSGFSVFVGGSSDSTARDINWIATGSTS